MNRSKTGSSTGRRAPQLLAFLLLLSAIPSVWAGKPVAPDAILKVVTVTTDQTIELILNNPELVVIDARLFEEYRKGHIEGALPLVDSAVTSESLAKVLKNKGTPVLFYCNGPRCLRSSRAAIKALSHGYTNIFWFRDGWAGWLNSELPISH